MACKSSRERWVDGEEKRSFRMTWLALYVLQQRGLAVSSKFEPWFSRMHRSVGHRTRWGVMLHFRSFLVQQRDFRNLVRHVLDVFAVSFHATQGASLWRVLGAFSEPRYARHTSHRNTGKCIRAICTLT